MIVQVAFLVMTLAGTTIASPDCSATFASAGINTTTLKESVAHGIHSITVKDIRYFFEPDFPEANDVPTVNPNFDQNHTLPYAPFGSQYLSPGMGVLDILMSNDYGNDTYLVHGSSKLEKLAHGMHMVELWHKTSKAYQTVNNTGSLTAELCSCLTDESGNGILDELILVSKYLRNFGNDSAADATDRSCKRKERITENGNRYKYNYRCYESIAGGQFETFQARQINETSNESVQEQKAKSLPHLDSPESWQAWKDMLHFSMLHDYEIEHLSKYLYCKLT